MKKIGIIGYGNMGQAIAGKLKYNYEILVFDKDKSKLSTISGINIAQSPKDLVNNSEVIILAVKPQDFDNLLDEIKNYAEAKLIISIAAGVTTSYIENKLGKVKVIRVMPNLPAKIGKGMTCLCKGKFVAEQDLNLAKELFDKLGKTAILNEDMMDAATAISGSGPGFFYEFYENKNSTEAKFIDNLIEAAKNIGFTLKEANLLVNTTVKGSQALLEQSSLSASELKKQITSKGGTTEAGLGVLHNGGTLQEAVKAALKRAKELLRS